ncbi:hypothetical protein B0O80DRAFT_433328 [Mortierella sp. GBAus27b]|nr:hypothetical protein BGX31_007991 [Mortierella sp. GBA43]KAI8363282.1 hypothetical protein B0O80DRAFT_433328 [Mortierella sp. GBAus27b]
MTTAFRTTHAGLYPILGVFYLAQHISHFGPQFVRSLVVSFLATLAILLPLSALTFKFQRRLVLFFLRFLLTTFPFFFPTSKTISFLGMNFTTWSTLILTLGETSLLIALVMGEVLKKERSKGLFKAVITHQNVTMGPLTTVTHHHLQQKLSLSVNGGSKKALGEDEHSDGDEDEIKLAPTSAMISPKESKRRKRDVVKSASAQLGKRVMLWFATLPLTFFPVLGPVVFCYINCKTRIPDVHRRYFDMKDMTVEEREKWIHSRQDEYTAFAFVSQALELVPIFSILFGFTNTIGAALWAADLERDQDTLRNKKILEDVNPLES